ncbi:hypothetical protein LPJ56_003703 [Coemansia sp. RSA 2599]|nr:hypothetical protein LPJ75_003459 [Coemansia sp. RSA 2598]KAJ1819168.1 hypothetical protein LPJ56_003703 [Coemansia sp. RSA 2599]
MNNPYANDRQSYPATGVQPGPVSQPSFVHHTGPQGQQSFVHQLGPPVMMTAEQPLYAPQAQQPNALPPAVPGYYQASHLPYYSCIGNPNMPPGSYITMDKIPANINCPRCNTPIITKIKSKATAKTVVAAAAIGFIFWPLAFVPFMSRRMKKTVHVCPKCSHTLGKVVTVASVPSYQY